VFCVISSATETESTADNIKMKKRKINDNKVLQEQRTEKGSVRNKRSVMCRRIQKTKSSFSTSHAESITKYFTEIF